MLANNSYSFELPTEYKRSSSTSPTPADHHGLLRERMPEVVHNAVLRIMPRTLPTSPQIAFAYVVDGHIPPFVINHFMAVQEPRGPISNVLRFRRAVNLMEHYRATFYRENPPTADPVPLQGRPLPVSALEPFFRSVQASLQNMIARRNFDPLRIEEANVFLQEMRNAVMSSPSMAERAEDVDVIDDLREQALALASEATEPVASSSNQPSVEDVLRYAKARKDTATSPEAVETESKELEAETEEAKEPGDTEDETEKAQDPSNA